MKIFSLSFMPGTVSQFSIHGKELTFTSTSSAITTSAQHHLGHFHQEAKENAESLAISLKMTFEAVERFEDIPVTISSSARRLFSRPGNHAGSSAWTQWPCDVYLDHGRLIANFHTRGLLYVDGPQGFVHGYLVQPEAMHPDHRVRFIHSGLTELLKYQGMYTIHATALEKHGKGILIPGASGKGKTTTFLSLLRSGYRCLSDDHPFIHQNGKGLEVLAFPVKVDVTEKTIRFFPELQEASPSFQQGLYKRFFYVEDLYPGGTGQSCRPRILLFPHVVDSPHSSLVPLPKSEALQELMPQGLLVYDQTVAKHEFQTLTRLVQQVDCYRLNFGRDVLDLPKLIDPLMDAA